MKIAELCRRNAITVRADDELLTAARLMRERHIGYLVVAGVEAGVEQPVGVLTDRDIVVTVVAREADPGSLRVGDVMTRDPVTVSEADTLEHALREMRRAGVRRLPVLAANGALAGVVSLDDVLDVVATQLRDIAGSVRTERVIESTLRP